MKKQKTKSNPLKNPIFKRFSLTYLFAGFLILDVIILVVITFLFVFVRSAKIKKIDAISRPVTFSYFLTRPDLLSTSKALVVFDLDSEVILASKNSNLRFTPASTVKIMTALVVLEHFNLNDILSYEMPLVNSDSSRMGLFVGEKMTVQNLLYGMMLPSGSDAAYLLAASYPGGKEAFVRRMNEKANDLGLSNTHFSDPAGYEDENFSTAYDLVRLGRSALQNHELSKIIKTKNITVYNNTGTISHSLDNLNELLSIDGVTGIKTGFTNEAEGVLVTSFEYNGKKYIIAVLRSKDRFSDTKSLISGIISDLKNESYVF